MASYEKYKLKNGKYKWGVRGYIGIDKKTGKEVYFQKRGFNTKTEAKLYFEKEKTEYVESQLKSKVKPITFNQLFEEFLPYYADTGVTGVTQSKLKNETKAHILPIIGRFYIDEITIDDMQSLVSHVKQRRKDFRKVLGHARSIFKYAVSKGYLIDNPMNKVSILPSKVEYPERRVKNSDNFYSTKQMMEFLNYYEEHGEFYQFVYFRLLAFSGLRRGEALGLKADDLNEFNQSITINRIISEGSDGETIVKRYTKTRYSDSDKAPVIYLDQLTFELLSKLAKSSHVMNNQGNMVKIPKKEYIFTSYKTFTHFHRMAPNDWLKAFWRQNKKDLEKLGLHYISPHGFRHSQATMLHELGVSLKDAQHRLRHKNIKTTSDVYTHISENRERLAADKLNSLNEKESNHVKNHVKIIQFPR